MKTFVNENEPLTLLIFVDTTTEFKYLLSKEFNILSKNTSFTTCLGLFLTLKTRVI